MSNLLPLRPIGTEFEEIAETPTERTITRLKVTDHILGADGEIYELIEELSTEIVSKHAPAPSEKK